jgi:hypothetical protein
VKSTEELLGLTAETKEETSARIQANIAKGRQQAMEIRRQMVEHVNANQRLEGYEPDEQLTQLQERFIAGELETSQMIELLTQYGREAAKAGMELPPPSPSMTEDNV